MSVELPSNPDVVAKRLAALEDPFLAERLFLDHPELFAVAEPPRTQRQVLAWATRRFGTVALAVTAAASIIAGYVVAPLFAHHPAPALAPPAPARHAAAPMTHHAAAPMTHHAAAPVTHHAAAPVTHPTHHAAAPVTHHAATIPAAPYRIVVPVVHAAAPVLAPATSRTAIAARHARLRAHAAAAAVSLTVTHHPAAATRTAPLPQPQPRTQPAAATAPATATANATATAVTTAVGVATTSAVGAGAPDPTRYDAAPMPDGTKSGPTNTGLWTEQGHGTAPVGTVDPCTPRGGRMGAIMGTLSGLPH